MNSAENIRLLLIEDHDIVRQGLKLVLELDDAIEVVGEAADGRLLEELISETSPNMILLDMDLPYIHGITICKEAKKRWPHIKVLILTAYIEDSVLIEAIRSGADGYLLKDIGKDALIKTIKDTFSGKNTLHPDMVSALFDELKKPDSRYFNELTEMEEMLLSQIAEGKTNKEIAESMELAEKTVRNYCSLLFRKIKVENRTEASNYYNKRVTLKGHMSFNKDIL